MNKSKNLGGFITIPLPAPDKFPMSFEGYKKEYGVDLMDILTDNPEDANLPAIKASKPILTEDVDMWFRWMPKILPLVVRTADDKLHFIHGYLPDSGYYMQIDWGNKTLSGGEL